MFRSLLLGIAVLGSLSVFGAVVPSEEKTTALVPSPSEGKIIGLVDLRPSDVFKGEDTFRMENSAELGYRFNPKLQLTYKQETWGNLVQPSLSASPNNFFVRDGYDVGSLMKNDLSDTQIGDGLRDGVVQMIFKAML
jgi:hypothetical protein